MSPAPPRVATIDSAAIAGNVRRLRAHAGTPELMAVVKADGYGHGAVRAARAALDGGADRLGVADVAEALELRAAGIEAPILAWLHGPDPDFSAAAAARIDLGVSSPEQLQAVADTAAGSTVHLKLDTGLSRNGVPPERWAETAALAASLQRAGRIRVEGVFSHLANASDEDDAAAEAAFGRGLAVVRAAGLEPTCIHLASTAAAIRRPAGPCTMVRVGIGVYGLSPFDDGDADALGLVPAMTLSSRVAATRRVAAGAGVSYDYVWRAPEATNLALVPLGYADGVPRAASDRAEVLIRGRRRPVRGRIAMDQFVVDTGDDVIEVGEPVVLFGDPASGAPGAADWAAWAGTIGYEIVTRLGRRVTREDR